ncbi:MAG: DUF547 domain-containing protein [Pseudomonadota bacterium]
MLSLPAFSADEPSHTAWTVLLKDCVVTLGDGGATAADYDCFDQKQSALKSYLDELSSVTPDAFASLPKESQLAFLINAYNAWTVELILSEWPDLESIRDLGNLFRSPWKKKIVRLFGQELSLDDVEHGRIREQGVYDDPRIHFAVNCASIGCPALREEAYTGTELETQLEQQTHRFLGDRSRNRLQQNTLEVSSIFKWYRDDFEAGWRGTSSLPEFFARYAVALDATPQALTSESLEIDFLSYDWALNKP